MPREIGGFTNIVESLIAGNFWVEVLLDIEDPVAVISTDYRIIWANKTLLKALGSGIEQARGRFCHELVQKSPTRCPHCPVAIVLSSGKPAVIEKSFNCCEGSPVWKEVRAYPIRAKNGTIHGAIRIGFDITKKKILDDQQTKHVKALERALSKTPEEIHNSMDLNSSPPSNRLTNRERQVLRLISKGFSNTEIARILNISPHTVKSHVMRIFEKLGINSRTDAAVTAIHQKII